MMKKAIYAIAAPTVIALGLTGISVSATAIAPATTTPPPVASVQVVKLSAKAVSKTKKLVNCLAEASKHEQRSRPVDPYSKCKDKLKVRKKVKAVAFCPAPLLGGRAESWAKLTENDLALAWSRSVAAGNSRTKARTLINDVIKLKASAWVTCVNPSTGPTPPREMITVCDLATKQIVTIYAEEFSPAKYSKNLADCASNPAPQILEVDTVNDVLINNSRYIKVVGTVAPGHAATLFATADNGGSITANKTQTVSGSFTVKVTYRAPSEPPLANNGIAAGKDRVTFTLTQDDGQQTKLSTNQFGITVMVPDPL